VGDRWWVGDFYSPMSGASTPVMKKVVNRKQELGATWKLVGEPC